MFVFQKKYWLKSVDEKLLNKAVTIIEKVAKVQKSEIVLTFCDNRFIQKLNKKFRKINKPTDVLSFPLEEKAWLGDIIISLPKAKVNAATYGNKLTEEVIYLIIHGLLHLLGYDHDVPNNLKKMRQTEDKFLDCLRPLQIEICGRI